MTAYNAQVHCSGVQSVVDNKATFQRTFKFSNGGKLFPLRWMGRVEPMAASEGGVAPRLKNYAEQQQMNLQDLESYLCKECLINPINRP
jgi:hypothetical protein